MATEALASVIKQCDGDAQLGLLDGFGDLAPEQQEVFRAQLQRLFPAGNVGPTDVFRASLAMSGQPPTGVEPPATSDLRRVDPESDEGAAIGLDGLRLMAAGKAAVVVLAGGSGTRLGVSYPKGMLECPDLARKKSLFQLQCEKLQRAERLARDVAAGEQVGGAPAVRIPLVYMTSPATDAPTRKFFEDNLFFGLHPSQVHFCVQSTMPCFTEDGRIILAAPGRVAEAPGGNAGIYGALGDSGVLDRLAGAGVEYCQVVTVDNLLVRIADPVFFGVAARSNGSLDVAVKTVTKASDSEAVGVFARRGYPDGAVACSPEAAERQKRGEKLWGVVEYTEIGAELAAAKNEAGERRFNCANIGIHLFSVRFLQRAASAMRAFSYYHIARKPIPSELAAKYGGDAEAGTVKGVKLEAFIFDLFLLVDPSAAAGAFALIYVDRAEEFSAIKNADDPTATATGAAVKRDSPGSAVRDLHRLHAAWLRGAIEKLRASPMTDVSAAAGSIDVAALPPTVEISPAFAAFGAADVAGRLTERPIKEGPLVLQMVATAIAAHMREREAEPFVLDDSMVDGTYALSQPSQL